MSAAGLVKVTRSDEETRRFGAVIGANVCPGDIILLTGTLGAGKTCLTQGIARGLDIDDYVSSPTFVLVREHQGRLPLYHADLYRLDDIREIAMLGMDEYFYGRGVTVVEWAEKGEGVLPLECLHIGLNVIDDNTRQLSLDAAGERHGELLREIGRKNNPAGE
jgi:tRNA threonylcarbamoyladenosine biosynthesis protein TsaE